MVAHIEVYSEKKIAFILTSVFDVVCCSAALWKCLTMCVQERRVAGACGVLSGKLTGHCLGPNIAVPLCDRLLKQLILSASPYYRQLPHPLPRHLEV